MLLLTSKGASGVTGSGFIVLAATLSSVPAIPVAGLALILGIDRFMSEARALTNLIGNGVATIVVSKWEKELDVEQMRQGLRRDVETELDEEAHLKHAPKTWKVAPDTTFQSPWAGMAWAARSVTGPLPE